MYVYQGDWTNKKTFEEMTTLEREIAMNNLALDKYDVGDDMSVTKPVGYFSFGNVGDSYTNYMIRGPLHKKTTLLDKYFDLIKADVDVLTSGAEAFDEKFAKVKDFGIELFDVNDLIFKDDSITFDNKHIFMARMESNKAQIKERIAEQLKQRYKNYKKSMKQRGIEAKADMLNK